MCKCALVAAGLLAGACGDMLKDRARASLDGKEPASVLQKADRWQKK